MAVLVLLSSVPLFMVVNKNFMPQDDQAEFEVNLRAPEGTSLESTEVITNRIANAMRQQVPEVDYTLVTVGGDPAKTRNLGNIYIRLTPIEIADARSVRRHERRPQRGPAARWRAGLRTAVQPVAAIGGGGSSRADVQFVISGPDLRKLESISRQLVERIKTIPGVVDPRHVDERRQAGALGAGRSSEGGGPRRADRRCG